MIWLLKFWKPLAGLAVVLGVLWYTHHTGYQSGAEDVQKLFDAHLKGDSDATLATQNRWQSGVEEAQTDGQKAIAQQTVDLAAADAADGLRTQLAAARHELAERTAAAERGKAASKAAGVLSDLYQGCERERRTLGVALQGLDEWRTERRDLADYADRARIAGETCQASFNALRTSNATHH